MWSIIIQPTNLQPSSNSLQPNSLPRSSTDNLNRSVSPNNTLNPEQLTVQTLRVIGVPPGQQPAVLSRTSDSGFDVTFLIMLLVVCVAGFIVSFKVYRNNFRQTQD